MNDAWAFYLGLLAGMPIGALVLIALCTVGTEVRKQRAGVGLGRACRHDLSRERMARALRGAVH